MKHISYTCEFITCFLVYIHVVVRLLFLMHYKILTATDLTALINFLLSKFFKILLTCVSRRLLLNLMSLIQIPENQHGIPYIQRLAVKFHRISTLKK